MAKEIVMPKLGLTMTEGTVSKWLKNEGDAVKEGEPLFEVETDKLTNTIEASASGTLLKIYVPAGGSAKCLERIAFIGQAGDAVPDGGSVAPANPFSPVSEPFLTRQVRGLYQHQRLTCRCPHRGPVPPLRASWSAVPFSGSACCYALPSDRACGAGADAISYGVSWSLFSFHFLTVFSKHFCF